MKTTRVVLEACNMVVPRGATFSLQISELQLLSGRVTCVVGANGCGKTTLLETLVGLLQPRKGSLFVDGHPIIGQADRMGANCDVGFVPDDDGWIIPELTAQEYFALLASLYAKAGVVHDMAHEAELLANALQFTQKNQQIGSLSHGNRKKVQLIGALVHRPGVIIVDELRNGLDPIAIKQAEQLLQQQRRKGTAILAATHDLWWAERFADDIVMIQAGRVLLQDSTRAIIKAAGSVQTKFMELYQP